MIRTLSILLTVCLATTAVAQDKLLLRDGREIEGNILREDQDKIVIMTAVGKRSYRKTKIREVQRAEDKVAAADQIQSFAALSPIGQHLRNARAERILGRNRGIVDRLVPLIEKGNFSPEQMKARWVVVEAYERLGEFGQAETLLKEIREKANLPDQLRARAHLDIFEQNPGYKLERVNDRLARNFLERELYLKGKQPNALADGELMRKALEEYVDQILLNKRVSLHSLKEMLDLEETLEALRQMPAATSQVEKYLPYYEHLEQVEESITKAQAILPEYGHGYELDLLRTESEHLQRAIEALFDEVFARHPDNSSYAYDGESGKLTKEGREQWRENCDAFLADSKPLIAVAEYLLTRTARFPLELERVTDSLTRIMNRLKRTREAIMRKRDRTHV
jgi:hypothetical protein